MIKSFLAVSLVIFCGMAAASNAGLQMVGQARLTFMIWPVYDSRLYSTDGVYREGQLPLRLEIQYLREVFAKDLIRHTQTEWQRQGLSHENDEQWLESLSGLLPDVRKNDELALLIDKTGRSSFALNGRPLGQIDDPQFGRQFLSIWLSPHTSQPALREALLGIN